MSPLTQRLILFAKRPLAGLAKTRLVPVLGESGALSLYRAMLLDALATCASLARPGRPVEVSFDRAWTPRPPFDRPCERLERTAQGPGDLGERLLRAARRAGRAGSRATVFLGADAPTLAAGCVEAAFEALAGGADVVLGPATDGGYVLIGVAGPFASPFEDIPWGTPAVLDRTRERVLDAGLRLAEVPGGDDVDDGDDLARLLVETRRSAVRSRCPATTAWCDAYRSGRGRV